MNNLRRILSLSLLLFSMCTLPVAATGQPLQGGTDSTTLQGGTGSTTLEVGTESTMLQTGTSGALIHGSAEREGGPVTILFLVDASLSMKDNLGNDIQKMDAAKQVLQNSLMKIPHDVNVGLRVFGQYAVANLDPCHATALLVPPGTGNRGTIIKKMRQIIPTGMTPLTFALAQAAERDLPRVQGRKTIILITDGEDTCGFDPCAYIQTLPSRGINLKVDILGLGMKREKSAKAQLDCIARNSGGKYYDNDTSAQLIESISHSVSQAISGTVLTPGMKDKGILNPDSPPELIPIVPAGKLEDYNKLNDPGVDNGKSDPGDKQPKSPKAAPAKGSKKEAPKPAPPIDKD